MGILKVKSGCHTCRARKVKCDEKFPICRRCVTAGRVCAGYGVWGGGGNVAAERQCQHSSEQAQGKTMTSPSGSISILIANRGEKEHLDWFKCRTVTKLPGSFMSDFWNTLLFQATISEPAVLHAVVALGSLHRRGVMLHDESNSVPDEQLEQYTLQHYVKAINHLRPHFLAKDKASFRVVLIICIVFISLDFLRGHFNAAQVHLQNGLKLLKETQWLSHGKDDHTQFRSCREPLEDWIVEVLSRLQLQVELFKQPYLRPCLLFRSTEEVPISSFRSLKGAWLEMDGLMNRIFYLTEQAHEYQKCGLRAQEAPALLKDQQNVQMRLVQWLNAYNEYWTAVQSRASGDSEKAHLLPRMYHTMATIMSATCLSPGDEAAYDLYTDDFLHLIEQLAGLWKATMTTNPFASKPYPITLVNGRSMVDMGWIPPLYYIAIKCRVHRIRLQAVRLLVSTNHREGIWDAQITGLIARKVMDMEEGDYYAGMEVVDDFPLSSIQIVRDLEIPLLPVHRRIRDIEIGLSGDPLERVLIYGKVGKELERKTLLAEYDITTQCWLDTEGASWG